jgi:hypothetical protein
LEELLMKRTVMAISLATMLGATPAFSQSGVEIGMLTCKVKDVTNLVVYTTQDFGCEFKPSKGEAEAYAGKISKIGLDLSVKNDFTIVWAVLGPTEAAYQPHALAGTYGGVGADVALGAGAGAKVLVGGSKDSFSLQPVSVAGVEGAGASVGIEEFNLK